MTARSRFYIVTDTSSATVVMNHAGEVVRRDLSVTGMCGPDEICFDPWPLDTVPTIGDTVTVTIDHEERP